MLHTRLSSKGQVIIPHSIRTVHGWEAGVEFEVIETSEGILLKPSMPYPKTTIEDLLGCLSYKGKPKTLKQMEAGIAEGARRRKC